MPRLSHSAFAQSAIDSLVALGLAVASVAWANELHGKHSAVVPFLVARMTLLNASFSVVFVLCCRQCFSSFGLYRRDFEQLRRVIARTVIACAVVAALLTGYLDARHARSAVGLVVTVFAGALFAYETSRVLMLNHDRWHIGKPVRVIIIGSGRRAGKAWRELRLRQRHTRQLVGFVDDRDCTLMAPDIASRFLGTIEDLPEYLRQNPVDELIVASPIRSCYDVAQRAVSIAEAAGVRVVYMNDVFMLTAEQNLEGQAALFVELLPKRQKRWAPSRQAAPERLQNASAKEALLKRSTAVS